MTQTDKEFLLCLKAGDETAFENIFLQYHPKLYRLLLNLLGSHDEAEDVLQEVFMVLYSRPPKPDKDTMLLTWLSRVALNRGYDFLRRKKRQKQRQIELIEEFEDDPMINYLRHEEQANVQKVLAKLSEKQSRLLILFYSGYSYSEIAAVLKINAGSVGTFLVRAKESFTKAYKKGELSGREELPKGGLP